MSKPVANIKLKTCDTCRQVKHWVRLVAGQLFCDACATKREEQLQTVVEIGGTLYSVD